MSVKYFYLVTYLLSLNLLAQTQTVAPETKVLDVDEFCTGSSQVTIDGVDLAIKDDGFCKALKELKAENEKVDASFVKDIDYSLSYIQKSHELIANCEYKEPLVPNYIVQSRLSDYAAKSKDRWKLRMYASHSFTTYFDTDLKLNSSRYDLTIKDYHWTERGNRNFFQPKTWAEEGNNPLQMIDEPSNTFTISIEKDGHEFFLSAFHPKFFQTDQTKHMTGTIDGVYVDKVQEVNKPFDGYNQEPGEMELVRNQNTHLQMMFEVGYGHRFKLLDGKAGSLTYTPSIGVGVTTGQNLSVVVKEGQWWDFDEYEEKNTVQGYGGSIYNRLEYTAPKGRIGVFYENRLSYYKQDHGFLDGTQQYDLKLMGNSVGVTFMLYNPNNKKKKKK